MKKTISLDKVFLVEEDSSTNKFKEKVFYNLVDARVDAKVNDDAIYQVTNFTFDPYTTSFLAFIIDKKSFDPNYRIVTLEEEPVFKHRKKYKFNEDIKTDRLIPVTFKKVN